MEWRLRAQEKGYTWEQWCTGVLAAIAVLLILTGVPGLCAPPASTQQSQPQPIPQTPEQKALTEAQTDREKAQKISLEKQIGLSAEQIELTKKQRQALEEELVPPNRWRWILKYVVPAVTAVGAILIGLVALANYLAGRRDQKDTQLYEALKRFGDKDSAALRASAARLLSIVGETGKRRLSWSRRRSLRIWKFRIPSPALVVSDYPRLEMALDHLLSGALLEDNPTVLRSLADGAVGLLALSKATGANRIRLYEDNLQLQRDLAATLCGVLWAGRERKRSNPKTLLSVCARAAGYDTSVLSALVERHKSEAVNVLPPEIHGSNAWNAGIPDETLTTVREQSDRLRTNVGLLFHMLSRSEGNVELPNVFLVDATPSILHLQSAHLEQSQLQGMTLIGNVERLDLSGSYLQGSDLLRLHWSDANFEGCRLAKTRGLTSKGCFERTDWWLADFGDEYDELNIRILDSFIEDYGYALPKSLLRCCPEVRDYLAAAVPVRPLPRPVI